MKSLLIALRITLLSVLLCGVLYPLLVWSIGLASPHKGSPQPVLDQSGRVVGYHQIGQPFSAPHYFQPRPSAVAYNGGGSGGSNKGPTNPTYLAEVGERAKTFRAANGLKPTDQLPVDIVTASGSGLDPHISADAARLQATRVLRYRTYLSAAALNKLIDQATETSMLTGMTTVNVLQLNLSLDQVNNR